MTPIFILGQEDEEPGYFMQALIDFIMWFIDWLCELVKPFIEWILELIPPDWVTTLDESIASFTPFGGAVNHWIALDWAFSLLGAWIIFMVAMITVKLVVKLFIPTVG